MEPTRVSNCRGGALNPEGLRECRCRQDHDEQEHKPTCLHSSFRHPFPPSPVTDQHMVYAPLRCVWPGYTIYAGLNSRFVLAQINSHLERDARGKFENM